ncbi:hypothetical protein F4561_002738 [Lipingzhangella halophila]|uniref:Uncharacterized protein n=1 Tax=Lipingzhangella halophila TaxID=1783352 RepID=A0A7W7W2Y1_9ACTN|nr:hypothetical protein [Lipingzhangella halophila]MBB4931918.1 hypothetical protein [Lipingzhangella halophila]
MTCENNRQGVVRRIRRLSAAVSFIAVTWDKGKNHQVSPRIDAT